MNIFPSFVIDDFYSDPDKIREWALSQKFYPTDGRWPGRRTKQLFYLDIYFYELFCKKIFSIFFDSDDYRPFFVDTCFQLIDTFDSDPNSPKNKGWIHWDHNSLFGGIIYLNPNIETNTGTSLFKLKNSYVPEKKNVKEEFYTGQNSIDYDEVISEHNSQFQESVIVSNRYNRLVGFDYTEPHGVNSFYSSIPRLTQVFFVCTLPKNIEVPVSRHRKFL